MYTLYLPKYKGDKTDFLVARVISKYMAATDYKYDLFSSPGYLSTKESKIDDYWKQFKKTVSCSPERKIVIGLTCGMNGNFSFSKSGISSTTYFKNIESLKKNGFSTFEVRSREAPNHAKMLFFIETDWNITKPINNNNRDRFLENLTVKALLIGSSNQSFSTFFHEPASKGEADILMFAEDTGGNISEEIWQDSIISSQAVLSQSTHLPEIIDSTGKEIEMSDETFLKNVFSKFLEQSLT